MKYRQFSELVEILRILRGKNGCPWDRIQTHETLIKYLREESFEVIEAIYNGDDSHLCEELGDLILQVIFHAQIAKERRAFNINDVLKSINKKMKKRHPHVFKKDHKQKHDLERQWDILKNKKGTPFDTLPSDIDPFLYAERIQLISAHDKFDWEEASEIIEKIKEEILEFEKASSSKKRTRQKEELGDILFSVINLIRYLNFDPYEVLDLTNKKFVKRYKKMLEFAKDRYPETKFKKLPMKIKEDFWNKSKKQ